MDYLYSIPVNYFSCVRREKIYLLLKIIFTFILLLNIASAQQWYHTFVPRGRHVNSLKFLGPETILYGGGNEFNDSLQELWLSTDKGLEWELVDNVATRPWIKSLAFTDTLTGMAVGYMSTIFKTVNGARFWHPVYPTVNRQLNKVIYVNPQTLYIAGGSIPRTDTLQTILKSIDSGNTWTVARDTIGYWLKGIAFTDINHGIAVGDHGTILRTVNGGASWNTVSSPVIRDFRSVKFLNASVGYITGGNDKFASILTDDRDSIGTILRTTNGGASWVLIREDSLGILNDITFTDNNIGYAVGDHGRVLKTTDGGLNWLPQTLPNISPNAYFNCVEFKDNNLGMIGGKNGDLYIYTTSALATTYTVGAHFIDTTNFTLTGAFDTHGETAAYDFGYSTDTANFQAASNFFGDFKSDTLQPASMNVTDKVLIPDTTYYFFAAARTLAGLSYGDTITFYTGTKPYTFQTSEATTITPNSAVLNGLVNKLPTTATLTFEYGITPLLGSIIAASPAAIADTFSHAVSVTINNLIPNTTYYFRLKGVHGGQSYYGDILIFRVPNPLITLPATNVTSSSATLNGSVDKLGTNMTFSFEYGTSPSFGSEITASPTSINDTAFHSFTANLSGLQNNMVYYLRLKGNHSGSIFYGNTEKLFTGTAFQTLETRSATNITDTTAVLNGFADKFRLPVTFSFEYGTSLLSLVNEGGFVSFSDTLPHLLSLPLSGLVTGVIYYYRIKAQTEFGTFYGNTFVFHTGLNSSFFNTTEATDITNTTAQIHGVASHLSHPAAISFDYGTTTSFGNTISGIPGTISDSSTYLISANLSGLQDGQLYYYRIKATNATDTLYGDVKQFYAGFSEIPNWDFQFWKTDTVYVPKNWNVLLENFERVPGHSGYAMHIFGRNIITNGIFGDTFFGGIPFTARPDSISAYVNCDIAPGDSAGMVVIFEKNGAGFDTAFFIMQGSTSNTFQRFAYKIHYTTSIVPDSILVFMAPTTHLEGPDVHLHNSVMLDDILFQPGNIGFPNSNFDNWFPSYIEKPLYWLYIQYIGLDTLDPAGLHMVSKAYFNPPNDFAAQLSPVFVPQIGMIGGELSTNKNPFSDRIGDFAVRGRHLTLNGYYNYDPGHGPGGGDSMHISINMLKQGVSVGSGEFFTNDSTAGFVPFSIPISYYTADIPDSGSLRIQCGGQPGTKLLIDKLSFDGFATSINNSQHEVLELDGMKVYPNPARDYIIIEKLLEGNKECSLTLFSMSGQVIRTAKLSPGQDVSQMEVGDLAPGFYSLILQNGNASYVKKIIIQK